MRGYTVIFDYVIPGEQEKRTYRLWTRAHSKTEAALRAGARFRDDMQMALPGVVQGISITGRSLTRWS